MGVIRFLADTCVLSETSKPSPAFGVSWWIMTEPSIYIPIGALIEFEMGIRKKNPDNPHKVAALVAWLDGLLETGMPVLDTKVVEVARKYGEMRACGALNQLFMTPANAKYVKGGQDVHIAAAAIVHGFCVASFDVDDYLRIHKEFELPGLYDPKADHWYVRPGEKTVRYPTPDVTSQ